MKVTTFKYFLIIIFSFSSFLLICLLKSHSVNSILVLPINSVYLFAGSCKASWLHVMNLISFMQVDLENCLDWNSEKKKIFNSSCEFSLWNSGKENERMNKILKV